MSAETYDHDGIELRLRALSPLVARLVPDLSVWFDEYVEVGEYGLAVEIIAEQLPAEAADQQLRELAAGLLAEARNMALPDETQSPLARLAGESARG